MYDREKTKRLADCRVRKGERKDVKKERMRTEEGRQIGQELLK